MEDFSSKIPPPDCNPDIYKNGESVVVLPSLSMHRCEHWVSLVRARCTEPIDWFYAGGRNVILTTGSVHVVTEAVRSQWLSLYELFKDQHKGLKEDSEEDFYSQEAIRSLLGVSDGGSDVSGYE